MEAKPDETNLDKHKEQQSGPPYESEIKPVKKKNKNHTLVNLTEAKELIDINIYQQ